jgi:hypothetical protein
MSTLSNPSIKHAASANLVPILDPALAAHGCRYSQQLVPSAIASNATGDLPPDSYKKEADSDFRRVLTQFATLCEHESNRADKITTAQRLLTALKNKSWGKHVAGLKCDLASTLLRMATAPGRIAVVLASTTALRELPFFLGAASALQAYSDTLSLELFVFRWESVCTIGVPVEIRNAEFDATLDHVSSLVRTTCAPFELHAVDVQLAGDDYPTLVGPQQFETADREILLAKSTPGHADPSLLDDVKWMESFYARQESFSKYGERQATLDLAMRRGIGRTLTEAFSNTATVVLASERKARLTKCYRLDAPAINVFIPSAE